ncbi:MAG TPA: zinc ABC transporter substrate-binding protein [Candidatus Omnitrophota bacterium]|nr:zinc ABC transporter substrate-binding protein [Candidatus Omnitrophota bacterium]
MICWPSAAQQKLSVITTIEPFAYFIEEITKEKAVVSVMIPSGANPHTYEPLPSQLTGLSSADLYVKVGSGIEFETTWMDKLISLNKKMKICNASNGIPLIPMEEHGEKEANDHKHKHTEKFDPHIWTSLKNAIIIIENILKSLIAIDPSHKDIYTQNAQNLTLKITACIKEIEKQTSHLENKTLLVFHPAWGYFAKDFGLKQKSVEKYGKESTPQKLARLIKDAKRNNIKIIFASPQFSQKSARIIAQEINGTVHLIDPLSKNYIESLKTMINILTKNIP